MPTIPIPIANGFYQSESLPISAQQCVNWYPNIDTTPTLERESLFGTPGINQLTTTGDFTEINRGSWVKNGIPYFVNGQTLYVLFRLTSSEGVQSFSAFALGAIEGEGGVSMADNGNELMVLVPGGKGYIYNENAGTPFEEITDAGFTANGNPQYVVFIDGYFACTTDSKKWIVSNLNQGLVWDALDSSTAESDPDITVAPVVVNNRIYITGSITTEGFQNPTTTGSGFPFIRSNVFMEKGCYAPLSIVNIDDTFMMIGGGTNESPAIWRFTGANFQKISTTPIDNALSRFTDDEIAEAFGYAYADKGAYFVGFTVANKSFFYDLVTQRWHERSSRVSNVNTRWRVNSLITAYGKVIVFDATDGRVGELDRDIYTEYGENILRVISTQPFSSNGKSIRVPMIELAMEPGVGNKDRPDPKVSLELSRDGKTFGYERTRSIGKIGEYDHRAIWYKNGRFPRFTVLRWKFSDPVKPVIIRARMTVA